ncbi:hypothetical protein K7X08_015870 [Anisodus acutangulus]|uniref:Legume lectin domain-containing protein n=1 Tax=Anisodus acutangulus TaxID=402998 RepID=A0A9Q1LCH2_9SOLA|nr:hypothetical protein K7X08_015870 [Anisodus acutangulus]
MSFTLFLLISALCEFAALEFEFTYNGFKSANMSVDGLSQLTSNGLLKLTDSTSQKNRPSRSLPAHYIGLLNDKNNGNITNHIVAVESDTILSCDFEDINDNHVGININQMKSEVLKPAAYYVSNNRPLQNLTLISGQIMQAWVEYDAASKQMHVTLAPVTSVKPTTPLLSLSYDLSPIIKETMFIGFSSATGSVSSSYYVLGWSFKINGMAAGLDISKLPRIGPKKVSRLLFIELPMILAGVIIVSTYGVVYYIRRRKFAELIEVWELEYGPHIERNNPLDYFH